MKYEELGKGLVKRTEKRVLGLFIDGTGLDRATRRLNRKVDMSALIRGVTAGMPPLVSRYYTLIPNEDDSRQRAFLDAVARAGLNVVVKRLPPKGITRQVAVDVEMATDIVAFALGHSSFSELSEYRPTDSQRDNNSTQSATMTGGTIASEEHSQNGIAAPTNTHRIVTVVCPSRDLSYPISLIKELGIDTVTADFGQFNNSDILKSAAKWIDLSSSETIWRE